MDNQPVNEGLELRNLLKGSGKKMEDYAVAIGMTRQNLNYHLRKEVVDDDFKRLIKAVLGIDFTNGKPAFHIEKPVVLAEAIPIDTTGEESQYNKRGTEFIPLDGGRYLMTVPIVHPRARAGYASGFGDPEFINELPVGHIVVNNKHHGIYRGFVIVGDSMDYEGKRAIEDGDTVYARQISRHLWKYKLHAHQWDTFVIHTNDGIIVKEIIEHDLDAGTITIRSRNPDKRKYPDEVIDLRNVKEIYNVVKIEKEQ